MDGGCEGDDRHGQKIMMDQLNYYFQLLVDNGVIYPDSPNLKVPAY